MDTINLLNEPMVMMKQREITKNSKYNKNKAKIHTFGMGLYVSMEISKILWIL